MPKTIQSLDRLAVSLLPLPAMVYVGPIWFTKCMPPHSPPPHNRRKQNRIEKSRKYKADEAPKKLPKKSAR